MRHIGCLLNNSLSIYHVFICVDSGLMTSGFSSYETIQGMFRTIEPKGLESWKWWHRNRVKLWQKNMAKNMELHDESLPNMCFFVKQLRAGCCNRFVVEDDLYLILQQVATGTKPNKRTLGEIHPPRTASGIHEGWIQERGVRFRITNRNTSKKIAFFFLLLPKSNFPLKFMLFKFSFRASGLNTGFQEVDSRSERIANKIRRKTWMACETLS